MLSKTYLIFTVRPSGEFQKLQCGNRGVMQGSFRGFVLLIQSSFFPQSLIAQQARYQRGVHGVSGAIGNHIAQYLFAKQRQVPDQVEDFVADEFIRIAQRRVLNPRTRKHYAVLARGAADQAHRAHGFFILARAEGARRRDFTNIISVAQFHAEGLFATQRMRKYVRGRRCLRIPALWIKSTNGLALPSKMGSSKLSSSTMALSMPMPMSAESKCSVVEMSTPFFIRLVA